jgi:tetratricopeptide (TPR) repeat protein
LHYAVARRNQILIEKLIKTCKADVNGGDKMRPSILDVLQYNRVQQKPFERNKDDEIEQLLLSYDAKNRCSLRRVVGKRKGSTDNDQSIISNLASLSIDLTTNAQLETARSHARMASSLQTKGDLKGAQESYKQAMMYAPDDTLDWATYAFYAALVHIARGERQLALELLQKALNIRKPLEKTSEDIDRIQLTIDKLQQQTS